MSSSRLPGKVLADLGPATTIEMVLRRLARAEEIAEVIVATSTDRSDDVLAATVEAAGVRVLRGPLDDVLARYALALGETSADAVVRITADCPLVEPAIVDALVATWRSRGAAYAANIIEPRTFPKGLDVEVISRRALEAAQAEAASPHDREHVTPFVRARPERFPAAALELHPAMPDARVTLDTPDDLQTLRRLIAQVGHEAGLAEIVAALGGRDPVVYERP